MTAQTARAVHPLCQRPSSPRDHLDARLSPLPSVCPPRPRALSPLGTLCTALSRLPPEPILVRKVSPGHREPPPMLLWAVHSESRGMHVAHPLRTLHVATQPRRDGDGATR